MKMLGINLLAALLWAAATGRASLGNYTLGFLLAYLALNLARIWVPGKDLNDYVRRTRGALRLVLFFLWELVLSNLKVAKDVLKLRPSYQPAIIAYPMQARGDLEVTLLAILVILTPGTLTMDVDEDAHVMYIHAMDAPDPEAFRKSIADGFEARLLEVIR